MSKLDNLIKYYQQRRQVGHTTLAEVGALNFDRPAVLIVASHRHGRQILDKYRDQREHSVSDMRLGKLYIRNIGWLDNEYLAYNLPVIVDHFALNELYHEHQAEWLRKLEDVRANDKPKSELAQPEPNGMLKEDK